MEVFVGTILPWPVDWAPSGWFLCNGALLQIQQYAALYSVIGVRFGGNGTSNFNLPNLSARLPMGMGAASGLTTRTIGQVGGVESIALTSANLPAHTHAATFTPGGGSGSGFTATLQASSASGTTASSNNNYIANAYYGGDTTTGNNPATCNTFVDAAHAGTLSNVAGLTVSGSSAGAGTVIVQPAGNVGSVPTVSPFLVINYISAL